MPSSKEKREAKKQAKKEAELSLIAASLGRSDLTGEVCYHDGPSFHGNAFTKMGLLNVIPVVRTGANSSLEHHHLWRLRKQHATAPAWAEFEPAWEFQKTQPEPSILSAIIAVYKLDFLIAFLLQICATAATYALPLMMPYLVRWFTFAQYLPFWWVFVYVSAIFGAQLANLLFTYHTNLKCYDVSIRIRASLTTMIYRKSLFSPLGRTQTSGMVVNLISTDAQILLETLPYFLQGILAPIQIIIVLGLLSRFLKAFCLISLAVALIAAPITGILASSLGGHMATVQRKGDIRLKLIKEFLTAIRIVKYYAWEKPFLSNITKSRLSQLADVRSFLFARAWLISVLTNIPGLGIGFTFFFYGLKYNMNFENVFSSLAFLNMLAIPFIFLPMLFAFGAQYMIALRRIEFFGLRSELVPREISRADEDLVEVESSSSSDSSSDGDKKKRKNKNTKSTRAPGGMYIQGASFAWETILSIAEGRFIDLENKATGEQAAVNGAQDAAEKKRLGEILKHTTAEKDHVSTIIRSIQKQMNAGTLIDEVSIEEEEKDCINAADLDSTTEGDGGDEGEEVEGGTGTKVSGKPKKFKKMQSTDDAIVVADEDEKSGKRPFAKLRRPVVNLHSIDFDVRPGKLTMIVGSVGSGKSTLAMAFLGEVHQLGGQVKVFEEFSYSSQEAWILNATIRDNIVFGSEFDAERYEEVIRCCALAPDLASFPASDLTEIGERGINLSGGQRQRINVARAMYSRAPIVILDDPFSAVDSHVGEHMFEHVAKGMRDSGRTVLLITNQLHFVSQADYIGVLRRGKLVQQGTYDALSQEDGLLAKMLAKQRQQELETSEEQIPVPSSSANTQLHDSATIPLNDSIMSSIQVEGNVALALSSDDIDVQDRVLKEKMSHFKLTPHHDEDNRRKGALIFLEERETGNIGFSTYWSYLRSGSLWIFLLYLITQSIRTALEVFSGIWLSWWSDPRNVRNYTKGQYLGGYIGLVLGNAVTTCIGAFVFVFFSVNTGKKLHKFFLKSVSKAPVSWFDRTPLGRIIARFSKDIALVDLELPSMFDQCIHFIFALLGLFGSIATGTPYILIILAVGVFSFGALTLHYRKTSIQVQRIEALSRAPIFSHFAETLEGAAVIRAFRMAPIFKVANMNKIDVNNVDFLGLKYCAMWFSMTLDTLGACTVALSYIAMILVRHYAPNSVNIGYIIFAISQTGSVCQVLAATSHMITDLENKMNSVERIRQYSKLTSEGPFERADTKPDATWPSQGHIVLEDLTVEYKKDIPVLHNLNCEFKPREKVGIVGRTGAGKSTLITALFRTMEPKMGRIMIDDVDITQIGLTDLRSKLSIIPQTPQLFVGTIRYNLDPFEEHDDSDLWRVLKMVKLKKYVSGLENGLLAPVEENGANFSVGQRQLLAMARCLLRETHVLLLDEATAAVDTETDALLQKMIRKNFKDKTVLTIAHRLNTIMDSDRILVLDQGNIAEFDTPQKLLKNKKGVLYGMVEATGPITSAYLREIASQKANRVRQMEEIPAGNKKSKN